MYLIIWRKTLNSFINIASDCQKGVLLKTEFHFSRKGSKEAKRTWLLAQIPNNFGYKKRASNFYLLISFKRYGQLSAEEWMSFELQKTYRAQEKKKTEKFTDTVV